MVSQLGVPWRRRAPAEGGDVRTRCRGVFGALGLRQVRGQDNVLRIAVGFERVFPAENENFLAAAQVVLAPEADASDVGILRARLEIVIDDVIDPVRRDAEARSEEHTSELQSLMRISYAVFCLKKK